MCIVGEECNVQGGRRIRNNFPRDDNNTNDIILNYMYRIKMMRLRRRRRVTKRTKMTRTKRIKEKELIKTKKKKSPANQRLGKKKKSLAYVSFYKKNKS